MNLKPELLDFIADRLVNVHGENPSVDYVLSLRAHAKDQLRALNGSAALGANDRIAKALESIAESLAKIANPLMADHVYLERKAADHARKTAAPISGEQAAYAAYRCSIDWRAKSNAYRWDDEKHDFVAVY